MNHSLHYYITVLLVITALGSLFAQDSLAVKGDSKYREDQFYLGLTYNLISKVPRGVNIKGLSGGVHFGFLRDMPVNEQRNLALALGLGLSFDQYGQTLFIGEDENEESIFRILTSDVNYDKNRLNMATLEIPLEFRWRTSTATDYKFWRIYSGLRMGYTYWYRSLFKQPKNEVAQTDISEFQNLSFAATLSVGYGTFNFFMHYALTPFFKNSYTQDTGEAIGFQPLKLGIIFYIL